MNNFLEDPKILFGLAILIFSVVIYFYINYQIGVTVKAELLRIKKHKQLKLAKHAQLKRMQNMKSRMGDKMDQDSYFDPADDEGIQDENNDDDYDQDDMHNDRSTRLTKDNILMRDMMGL